MEDILELGGNIELSGFREMDGGTMVVLKKIVGTYARKFSNTCDSFEKLSLTMKKVHETEGNAKFEVHCLLVDNGKNYASSNTDYNLFIVLDKVLKKIEAEMQS